MTRQIQQIIERQVNLEFVGMRPHEGREWEALQAKVVEAIHTGEVTAESVEAYHASVLDQYVRLTSRL